MTIGPTNKGPAQPFVALGREILALKQRTAHGEFRSAIEVQFSINYNTARKAMYAAKRLPPGTPRAMLANRLTRSKLLELLVLDDAALDSLVTRDVLTAAGDLIE